ncbi:MAG TPA: efflux RND transporter periplasmic adaptor subunit [Opitutales bacterium]|nr:efflux RND transporter periplasmic adaptor subunit [Opitutales bacterium]
MNTTSRPLTRALRVWPRLLLAFGIASLGGCGKPAANSAAPAATPPKSVSVATAQIRDVPVYLEADGQTIAFQSVNIVAQVGGQIVEMPFQQGSMVKKGDKLAVIDQAPYLAAVQKAQGQLDTDRANLKLAQDNVERNKTLLPQQYISQQQYDASVAQVAALQGQVQVDDALLKTAQINLDYTTITAPVDGMVGNYRINLGNVVKANDLPITTIQALNPIYADFVISESSFPLLRRHFDANSGKLTVHVSSLSDPTIQEDGELTILGNSIGLNTGTISLRATLPNDQRQFWPNQPVHVRILLDTLKGAIVIPETCVQLSQQGEYVFVVGAPAQAGGLPAAEMRQVQTGTSLDDGTKVITSGLKPGDQVIVEGQIFLAQGMPLMVMQADGKPTPAALAAQAAASGSAASGSGK